MLPNQPATKLLLKKVVVTTLTAEKMMNYNGKNVAAPGLGAGNTGGNTVDPPPNTDSCVICNSLIPDGCGTGTGILSW